MYRLSNLVISTASTGPNTTEIEVVEFRHECVVAEYLRFGDLYLVSLLCSSASWRYLVVPGSLCPPPGKGPGGGGVGGR